MEFVDYYEILKIPFDSTQKEIKIAFKKQAKEWHPDTNLDQDTTEMMQSINEAYLILKDPEARHLYNIEYRKYQDFKFQFETETHNDNVSQKSEKYEVEDEVLEKWMKNAKNQAINLALRTIKDLKGMSKVGASAAIEEVKSGIQAWFYMILIMGILALLIAVLSG